MPVPASYNDVTQDINVRDHVGLVWYDRKFFVSDTWRIADRRVWLRFSSVSYAAQVVSIIRYLALLTFGTHVPSIILLPSWCNN